MTAKYSKTLAEIVSSLCDGRTQAWLVSQTGIDKTHVSRFLAGKAELDLNQIELVANAFEMSAVELLSRVYDDGEFSKLIRLFGLITRAQRTAILRTLQDMVGDDGKARPARKSMD